MRTGSNKSLPLVTRPRLAAASSFHQGRAALRVEADARLV